MDSRNGNMRALFAGICTERVSGIESKILEELLILRNQSSAGDTLTCYLFTRHVRVWIYAYK